MNPTWLSGFPALSAILMRFGWFVAPYLTGAQYDRLQATCDKLQEVDTADEAAMAAAETAIFHALADSAFHPNYRAKYVRHGLRLGHFKDFSHLHESAIFAYYKREYAAAVLLLLAALEGILLSISGWRFGEGRQPGHRQLIQIVQASTAEHALPPGLQQAHDMYRDVFAEFLKRWLYPHTKDADLGLSVLNRHYVMHGFEPGNFYRPHDIHRMILAFDVLIDWLALNQRFIEKSFVDDSDPLVARRMSYYQSLSEGDQTVKQVWKAERTLLQEHSRYIPPSEEHDHERSTMLNLLETLRLMRMAAEARQPDGTSH